MKLCLAIALLLYLGLPITARAEQPAGDEPLVVADGKKTTLRLYVTAAQAYKRWKAAPESVKIIDVRTTEEYVFVGHPAMAWNVPFLRLQSPWDPRARRPVMKSNPDFVDRVKRIAKPDDVILLTCRSGGRSAAAVNRLALAGYSRVYSIIDGFEGDMVKDPQSAQFGKRAKNGWKNSALPWTYALEPKLLPSDAAK